MAKHSLTIASFKYGLDSRRDALVASVGSLVQCTNAFINEGGEVEQRQAFVDIFNGTGYDFTSTFGILSIIRPNSFSGNVGFVTFADYAAGLSNAGPTYPAWNVVNVGSGFTIGVSLFLCRHPKGAYGGGDTIAMTGVQWAVNFNGYPLVCAKFADGNCFLYYGGNTTPAHPIDASGLGLVHSTLTNATNLVDQLIKFVNGKNGPGLAGWTAYTQVASASLNAAGTGYSANDILTVTFVDGTIPTWSAGAFKIKVLTVSGGAVATFAINQNISFTDVPYTLTALAVTGGTGTGAKFNITLNNYAEVFSPVGVTGVAYSTASTNDPSQSISVQHKGDNFAGSVGQSALGTLQITGVGATGDTWTAFVETGSGTGIFTQIGQYAQVAGDTTTTVAAGIVAAINTTLATPQCTAVQSTTNVLCYGPGGYTTLNGARFRITTSGAGTIGAGGAVVSAVASPTFVSGIKVISSGSGAQVTSNSTTVTQNGVTGTVTYSWAYVSGDTTISATSPTGATTSFRASVNINTVKSAVFKCTVSGTGGPVDSNYVTVSLECDSNR